MSDQTRSIFSSLPPLKCAYQIVPIKEEQPYIAMEDLAGDNMNTTNANEKTCFLNKGQQSTKYKKSRCCNIFCFFS